MRRFIPLLASLALAQPAFAGQRAIYVDEEGKKLTVEVADDGNAVVRPEGEPQYGILHDGHFYLVGNEKGELHVARMEDMATAFDRVLPPIFKQLFDMASKDKPKSKLKIVPAGTRTIAGQKGQVYRVFGLDDEKPNETTEMVLSREPSIQPAGQAMQQFVISTVLLLAPFAGQVAADMISDMRAIFAYGAPLDMGRFKLTSLETLPLAPSIATLPKAPDTVEQIIASMKISSPEPN
jgi:hypothetical protein